MKKTLVGDIVIILLCSLLGVALFLHTAPSPTPSPSPLSSPTPTPTLSPSPSTTPASTPSPTPTLEPDALKIAVTNAINFFEESPHPTQSNQLYALMMLDVMYRRFGISEFADAPQIYDQAIEMNTQDAPIMRVFRRIADHDNQLQPGDLQSVTYELDRLTVPALYCDRYGLPDDYAVQLEQAANLGDYMLTHAVLSLIWVQENGCAMQLLNGFTQSLYQATATLINNDGVVDDLELEAAAFLYLAGQGSLVDNGFVNRAIAAQNYDGGWRPASNTPDESNWHATALGLLFLLHVEYPAASYPPMLAPASPLSTVLIITASGVSLAAVAAGVLVYWKKRKRGVVQE